MKNKEKQTREETNQKRPGSLSEAELDNVAGGGGGAVVSAPVIVDPVRPGPAKGGPTTAAPVSAPVRKHP